MTHGQEREAERFQAWARAEISSLIAQVRQAEERLDQVTRRLDSVERSVLGRFGVHVESPVEEWENP